jgi:hypothetical protein
MWSAIVQLAQLIAQNPQVGQVFFGAVLAARKTFDRLSPEAKAKVESAICWGVERAARVALTTVLGEVGDRVFAQVANREVAELAKEAVRRGVEIGVDKVLKELRAS